MYNCTVADNITSGTSSDHGGLENKNCTNIDIFNCIFWGNTNGDIRDDGGGDINVQYSIIDPSGASVYNDLGNNLNLDPLFTNAASGDYRLLNASSPAVDAGTTKGGLAPTDDLVNTVRNLPPDIGAFELNALDSLPLDCPSLARELLPVEFEHFSAFCTPNQIDFRWNMSGAEANDHIYFEGSTDGNTFLTLADQPVQTLDLTPQGYQLSFQNPAPDLRFYRMRVVSHSGESITSSIKPVDCTAKENEIRIYPNPTQNTLFLDLKILNQQIVQTELLTLTGASLQKTQHALPVGLHTLKLDISELHSGIYFLKIQLAGDPVMKKIVKQ